MCRYTCNSSLSSCTARPKRYSGQRFEPPKGSRYRTEPSSHHHWIIYNSRFRRATLQVVRFSEKAKRDASNSLFPRRNVQEDIPHAPDQARDDIGYGVGGVASQVQKMLPGFPEPRGMCELIPQSLGENRLHEGLGEFLFYLMSWLYKLRTGQDPSYSPNSSTDTDSEYGSGQVSCSAGLIFWGYGPFWSIN